MIDRIVELYSVLGDSFSSKRPLEGGADLLASMCGVVIRVVQAAYSSNCYFAFTTQYRKSLLRGVGMS